ncbi:hypothetical protein DICPUDRAFT_53913 [Dictyostelium purpureum]|uniref:Adenylyl cyclase-associated protein n=1 Tax=Dictyostelium purpureum TaxID=5786 RepID=F0ZET2_DICPU|nr:uncharacterized protein DICPUDRAFT_53913 [Dictyostelium purpureum]EGC37548.1 hypothetical protein DICPUDRAFT_53913 [Dictyostelium purpureum]|eukprot:XP_003285939.1 hypothetical protein DICPUDRAFT_53913 [Dictyostelium purpureum]
MNMSSDATVAELLKRLEAATTRLESLEKALATAASSAPASGGSVSAGSAPSAAAVKEFQNLIDQHITPFVAISKKLAPEVVKQVEELVKALEAEKNLINTASQSKKPSQDVLMELIKPVNNFAQQVGQIRDSNRSSKFFNNLSALSESVGLLSWVVVEPTPAPHVAEMRGSAEFYTNRILKEFKGVNQDQVDWVQHYIAFLKDLEKYIKQYHTTGLTWNPKGGDAKSAAPAPAAPAAPAPSAGGPPPPPPVFKAEPEKKGADMNAVFSQIGKGEGVTAGLKKVTNDMKSKNFTDKSSVVKASSKQEKVVAPAKPPKFGLEGNKWCVEYQVNNKEIIISETDSRQTVYIYQCVNTVVQIKGKVNAITLDGCKKTAIVFENAISSCEVVNCTSIEIQVTGRVPSVAIDKTSGAQVYLSATSLDTEIVSSKSSEMNVLIPGATPNDDLVEIAIPEQFKTIVRDNKLVTESVSHV